MEQLSEMFPSCNIPSSAYLFSSICMALILVNLVKWYCGRRHRMQLLSCIPGPKGRLFFGNVLELLVPPIQQFRYVIQSNLWYRKQSPVVLTWRFHIPFIYLLTPETAQTILSSNSNVDKADVYKAIRPWIGDGLLVSSGSKWHSRRKMITQTFHFKILGDFLHVMNQQTQKLLERLKPYSGGSAFNVYPYISLCTLDIICETAMGCSIYAQEDNKSEYTNAVERITTLISQRMKNPWVKLPALYRMTKEGKEFDKCLEILHGFTRKVIHQKRKKNKTRDVMDNDIGKKRRVAFLDLLLEHSENGQFLSDKDIREEVDTFMFGGYDTTASAISWALYLIGKDSKVQARIHKELWEVFGEDRDQLATRDDLTKLCYLECCIKEALRLFPSVPFITRTTKEDLACDQYIIPAKTDVILVKYLIHRDPNHWLDPEVYDPDRFNAENSRHRHPYAFLPFSAGPRSCIGQKFAMMEVKVALSTVLRNYKIESTVDREDLNIIGDLVLKCDDGISLKLHQH